MRLCDEYSVRCGIKPTPFKRPERAFLLFGDNRLLFIKWSQPGPHPGFYEVSECLLEKKIKIIKTDKVSWEEYDSFISNWLSRGDYLVGDRREAFKVSWEFFLRRNDEFLAANFDPLDVMDTLCDVAKAISFLDRVAQVRQEVSDFWWLKTGEIVSKYAFWLCDLAAEIRKD